MPSPRLRPSVFALVAAALAGACASAPEDDGAAGAPDARPLTMELNEKASQPSTSAKPDDRSEARVLAHVNGEVVTYRDVLLRVGPQLASVGTDHERQMEERRALVDILRDRILDRAALDAGIEVSRDEVDLERARTVRELSKGGHSLDDYLVENGISRREFDDQITRKIRIQRYLLAAIGVAPSARVRVRPVTDVDPSPLEMRTFYDRNPELFRDSEIARVRVMAFLPDRESEDRAAASEDARRRAEAALARLQAGEDFVPLYRELFGNDADPDVTDGLYEIRERPSKYAQWIEEYAFAQPRGARKIHALPEGRGFYVLQAEGFTPARTVPYEEAQDTVRTLLRDAKFRMGRLEVELGLLEQAAVSPRERYDDLRQYLGAQRRKVVDQTGM